MSSWPKKILSEISSGELLDKLTILEIKREKIKEKSSQAEIIKEYKVLKEVQKKNIEMHKTKSAKEKIRISGQTKT